MVITIRSYVDGGKTWTILHVPTGCYELKAINAEIIRIRGNSDITIQMRGGGGGGIFIYLCILLRMFIFLCMLRSLLYSL